VDGQWYSGLVQQYNPSTDEHYVLYPDGETEWIKIGDTKSNNSHQDNMGVTNTTVMHSPHGNVETEPHVDRESASHSRILADMKMGTIHSEQGSVSRNVGRYSRSGGGNSILSAPINHGNPVYSQPAPFPNHPSHSANVTFRPPAAQYTSPFPQTQGHNAIHQYNRYPPRYGHEQQLSNLPPAHPHINVPLSNMNLQSPMNAQFVSNSGRPMPPHYYTQGMVQSSEPMRPIHQPYQPFPSGARPIYTPVQRTTKAYPQNTPYNGPVNYPPGSTIPNNVSNFLPSGPVNYQHVPTIPSNNKNLGNFAHNGALNPVPGAFPRPHPPSHFTQRLEPMVVQPTSFNAQPLYHPVGPAPGPLPPPVMPHMHNQVVYQPQSTIMGMNAGIDPRIFGKGRKTGARPWTKQEDKLLLEMVDKFKGVPVRWPMVSVSLPGRTGKQCRERYVNNETITVIFFSGECCFTPGLLFRYFFRYVNHLNPRLNNSHWHLCEDASIFRLYSRLSSKWSQMANLIPGRTDNNIKNRFHNLRRQLESEDHHRKELSNLSEYTEEIRLDRIDPAPRYLESIGKRLWEVPMGIIAAQSVLATAEDPTVPDFRYKQFGPFREASSSEGEQCFRCGLFAPSVQCSKYICNRTRWCFACCTIPPHLSGDLLRDVLNLRRSLDKEERTVVESWTWQTSTLKIEGV